MQAFANLEISEVLSWHALRTRKLSVLLNNMYLGQIRMVRTTVMKMYLNSARANIWAVVELALYTKSIFALKPCVS